MSSWGRRPSAGRPCSEHVRRVAVDQFATLPVIGGAALTAAGAAVGPGIVAVGVVLSIAAGILDGWVLLVEILR